MSTLELEHIKHADLASGNNISLTSAGNVGVGVTPSSWASPAKGLQVGSTASLGEWNNGSSIVSILGSNSYFNSGYKYSTTNTAAMIRLINGALDIRVAPSGSADSAITFTTGLEVLADGKARAKNGLLFGTDTAATNTLDDYEEGNYTVAITMGTGTAAVASSANKLSYTKVGRLVTIGGQFQVGSVSSPDGEFQISLPFACETNTSGSNHFHVGTYRTYLIDTPNDGTHPVIYTNPGSSAATLQWARDAASGTNERATANGYFMIGLTYMAA